MGRNPREIRVVEVTFAEPTGHETHCPWTEATKVLLGIQERLAARSKEVTGLALSGAVESSSGVQAPSFSPDADALIADFCQVADLSGVPTAPGDIIYEVLPAPHKRPKRLPLGKKAVYVFATAHRCLKVGKVGPKSAARFTSQHYLPKSCQSNLAKSLLALAVGASVAQTGGDAEIDARFAALTDADVGGWISQNTSRHHFFLRADAPKSLLTLLETFLQCRLDPLFEDG